MLELSEQEKQLLEQIEKEKKELGYSPTERDLWLIDYERIPVPIRQFIEDEEYLGSMTKDLHEKWKQELDKVFAPNSQITTLILTGAIGTGKTTVATIALVYALYRLSCLRDIHKFYGLMSGKKIIFGCYNITLKKADVGYDLFKQYVDGSPYFRKHCPRSKRPDEPIYFPTKRIQYEVGSLAEHALGDDMLAFMLDEANFYKKTPDPNLKSRAHQLYIGAKTRLISRFMQKMGRVPGLVILISSRTHQSAFIEEQLKIVETDPQEKRTTHVVSFPLWEVKPEKLYSGERFRVAVGDENRESWILEEDELALGHKVISVPVEYLPAFRQDMTGSLMNFAGIAIAGSHGFITSRESIVKCIDHTRKHPFDTEEITDVSFSPKTTPGSSVSISDHFKYKEMCRISAGVWKPRIHPGIKRYIHVDLGLTNDACGFSMGHPYFPNPDKYAVYIDLSLRMRARPGCEIDLEEVVNFIVYLRKVGYPIAGVTFDRFESRMVIQQLAKFGFKAWQMGITLEHYIIARRMLFEGRVSYYNYPVLIDELRELRRPEDPTKRPNHPPDFHDDVADSFAGVVAHCAGMEKEKPQEANKIRQSRVPLVGVG